MCTRNGAASSTHRSGRLGCLMLPFALRAPILHIAVQDAARRTGRIVSVGEGHEGLVSVHVGCPSHTCRAWPVPQHGHGGVLR